MRARRIVLILLAALASAGGCNELLWVGLHVNNAGHMTIERAAAERVAKPVRVLDAKTRGPVCGARIRAVHSFDWMDDWVIKGTTDERGIAILKLAKQYGASAEVSAPGYMTRDGISLSDGASTAGVSRISDDPLDIYLYKATGVTQVNRCPRPR